MLGTVPSLAAFFEIWRGNSGEFLRYEGGPRPARLSYADAGNAAVAFAARLRAAGIGQGERIIFWSDSRPEWIVALWGCLLEGVIAVPLDFRSSEAVVERIAGIVSARALLLGEGLVAPAGLACPVWPVREVVVSAAQIQTVFEPAPLDQTAEILFTSGATGEPKGVTLTHRNIMANLKPIDEGIAKYRRYMGPFAPIRFLNLLPLSHMFGQSMAAFIPPMIAGEVSFLSSYSPREIVRLIRRRRISVLVCVPQMLDLLRAHILQTIPEAEAAPRSRKWYGRWWQYRRVHRLLGWKFWSFVVGAAPLDPALEVFWRNLGYVVIQGYGLTETAPVATLNHPFHTRAGSVGKPIAGVEIRIAPDGEVLLRGENITPGYFGETEAGLRDPEGWLHTGDIGELDAEGGLRILGRRKEMVVSPDGLNVFPEDVERELNSIPGIRESAVVAKTEGAREFVHAVLVPDRPDFDAHAAVSAANQKLEAHQRIKGVSIWPGDALPRTSGANKLRRGEVAKWVNDSSPVAAASGTGSMEAILSKYAGGRTVDSTTSLDDLGLSSLDRIQLITEIEQRTGTSLDESQVAGARTIADLTQARHATAATEAPFRFPEWNRGRVARGVRRLALPVILPLARAFAWIRIEGRENLAKAQGPVIFAANHQSHFDAPAILWSLPSAWRYRMAPAMAKEFFDAHFHPERYGFFDRFTSGLNYYSSCLVFCAFPLPQREAGAREALREAGEIIADGFSILIFPEGKRTENGEIVEFRPGVAMLAARLGVPVIPVRLEGLEKVLHRTAMFAVPGRAKVKFGPPIMVSGDDYAAMTREIEAAVRAL